MERSICVFYIVWSVQVTFDVEELLRIPGSFFDMADFSKGAVFAPLNSPGANLFVPPDT